MLDTGILIAALITSDTPPALISQAWCKKRFLGGMVHALQTQLEQVGTYEGLPFIERLSLLLEQESRVLPAAVREPSSSEHYAA